MNLDTSGVEGVDHDLVIRPFGRKGEFATVRQFDIEALQFHFGMQPAELVGDGVDQDGDGVSDEIMAGELSVLHIFNTNFPKPVRSRNREFKAVMGEIVFDQIGCATCHIPVLETESQWLTYSHPEVLENPEANVFYAADLTGHAGFRRNRSGGLSVDLFSDLKRHDMGDHLADATDFLSDAFNRAFITARLWGIRDTGPYLHDGRATTLKDAIALHGGEAQGACDGFNGLSEEGQEALIAFLYTLRTPNVERYVRGPRFEMFTRRTRDPRF
jgi:CxxC motif-containing protein (DUF1111 family)